ncbi:hypothetical protein T4C_11727, partial [Trichinella pseudospiralis]
LLLLDLSFYTTCAIQLHTQLLTGKQVLSFCSSACFIMLFCNFTTLSSIRLFYYSPMWRRVAGYSFKFIYINSICLSIHAVENLLAIRNVAVVYEISFSLFSTSSACILHSCKVLRHIDVQWNSFLSQLL